MLVRDAVLNGFPAFRLTPTLPPSLKQTAVFGRPGSTQLRTAVSNVNLSRVAQWSSTTWTR